MNKQLYGTTRGGVPVYEYTLSNGSGIVVKLITFGGIISSVQVPDRDGSAKNVALGFDSLAAYEAQCHLLRLRRRAICQPHRQWAVYPGRHYLPVGHQ